MRTVAIVQSRMASARLPGKALLPIDNHPLLWHVVTRVKRAKCVDAVVVATGEHWANQPIVNFCWQNNWTCFQGPEDDVLRRFHQAAQRYEADVIVRISGDSPLIDPAEIDAVIEFRDLYDYEYASNCHPPRLPDGLDTEVFTRRVLEIAHRDADLHFEREHVTPWMRIHVSSHGWGSMDRSPDLSQYRLCVDTQEDLDVMRELFRLGGPGLDWRKAVKLLQEHPELAAKNQHLQRNAAFVRQVEGEAHV